MKKLYNMLFGGGKKKVPKETVETRGMHMPALDIPVDEKFTMNFKQNGGKFIYCDSIEEIYSTLDQIIIENEWQDQTFFSMDPRLIEKFSSQDINFTDKPNKSDVFFTTCEHLIAQNGSILVSENQLRERKLNDLPSNLIVFATTSQMIENIGEGLKIIKKKYKNSIPTNITTIKHFQPTPDNSDDFLTYGSSSKNLYLLLLEDL